MAKRTTTTKAVSLGRCSFCREAFPKNKMTQHLKTCAARQAVSAELEGEKERLLHLQVEGRYRPEYWMHLELPAAATLADLDGFLRSIWLECCDHLSEFEIDNVSYEYEPSDWDMGFGGLSLVGAPSEGEDEEGEDEEDEGETLDMQEIASEMSKQLALEFQTDLKDVPVAEIEKKLEQMFAESMPPGMSASTLPMLRPLLSHMAESLQQGTLGEELAEAEEEEGEDGGMFSELGDVLEVGKKFSYVYDFGSSSTLSLRVLDEREGVMFYPEEEDANEEEESEGEEDDEFEDEDEERTAILIMARNEPPALLCHLCGKPATSVPSGSEYDSLAEVALCATHASKTEYPDELLPIVNSPRTGICGYDGDLEEDWDEEWDEDEDEEE